MKAQKKAFGGVIKPLGLGGNRASAIGVPLSELTKARRDNGVPGMKRGGKAKHAARKG